MTDFQLEQQWHGCVYYAERSGRDVRGQPSYGVQQLDDGVRVEPMERIINIGTAHERRISHRIFTNRKYLDSDRVWVPGANKASQQYVHPASVLECPDEWGNVDHYEVML